LMKPATKKRLRNRDRVRLLGKPRCRFGQTKSPASDHSWCRPACASCLHQFPRVRVERHRQESIACSGNEWVFVQRAQVLSGATPNPTVNRLHQITALL
jgi:hypothetical protein